MGNPEEHVRVAVQPERPALPRGGGSAALERDRAVPAHETKSIEWQRKPHSQRLAIGFLEDPVAGELHFLVRRGLYEWALGFRQPAIPGRGVQGDAHHGLDIQPDPPGTAADHTASCRSDAATDVNGGSVERRNRRAQQFVAMQDLADL
jgi:hypothetical protein